jgi:CIC family chloride channel protein
MGCLLAGTTHAPLTSVVMVFEMTLDYGVVVPLLVGCAVASLVARRLSPSSVYTEALDRKAGADVPEGLGVRRVADFQREEQVTVAGDLPLAALPATTCTWSARAATSRAPSTCTT